MPTELGPRKVQKAADAGRKRLENFRRARIMFLRSFVGQYYDKSHGHIGMEPLNLIFNAIRVLVPNIVFNYPQHNVSTRFLAQRDYADMLGMALTQQDKQMKIRDIYRRWVVDAIFTMGILKTGICDSGTAIGFDENDLIDPGTVYTENVDFDNLVIDPQCKDSYLRDAAFIGDTSVVPRLSLLESGLYNNALVERLPKVGQEGDRWNRADRLSARNINPDEDGDLEDMVEITELWVPRAKAIVTIPGSANFSTDDFLRVADYYGPDDGPYTFLRMTPPVPNNPIPVSMVGIWHDLHVMANKMAKKIMEQAERQKDIIGYKRSAADDAQEALDARDGEAVAMDDPDGVRVHSFGGQQRSNEAHINQLQQWFNMMAGNPEGMAGIQMKAKSATEAQMLQGNASVGLEDMKDLVYNGVAEEGRKRAWYLHTDPLLEVPLTRRVQQPIDLGTGMPAYQEQDIQVMLTPEARCGDFLDFTFEIEPESMGRVDSQRRLQQAMEFAVKLIPAAAQAAQTCMMMGVAFSFPRFVCRMAKEAGIKWMDEVFQDPEFQMRMAMVMMRGPQAEGSKGQVGGLAGIMQNGQPPGIPSMPGGPDEQFNRQAQEGAAEGQADLPVRTAF
jgi:hypothetical protein